ncbi:MAG: sigma factor [Planctomycetota bacterium]
MGLDPKLFENANRIIRHKARQLSRKPEFRLLDKEDLEQDLLLAILESWKRFDSRRASAMTFVARIIENKAASMVRALRAAKRDARRCMPIHGADELAANDFDEDEVRTRGGLPVHSALEAMLLRLDVAEVLAKLPSPLRQLCKDLMEESISNVARSWGRDRRVLYRALRTVRTRFVDAGLEKYL